MSEPREPLAYSRAEGPSEKVDNNMGLLNLRPGKKAADCDRHHQLNDLEITRDWGREQRSAEDAHKGCCNDQHECCATRIGKTNRKPFERWGGYQSIQRQR